MYRVIPSRPRARLRRMTVARARQESARRGFAEPEKCRSGYRRSYFGLGRDEGGVAGAETGQCGGWSMVSKSCARLMWRPLAILTMISRVGLAFPVSILPMWLRPTRMASAKRSCDNPVPSRSARTRTPNSSLVEAMTMKLVAGHPIALRRKRCHSIDWHSTAAATPNRGGTLPVVGADGIYRLPPARLARWVRHYDGSPTTAGGVRRH